MARLIANNSGNFTSSGTWGIADTTFVVDSENNSTNVVNSLLTTPNLIPGAITVDAVLLKIASRTTGVLGTFTVTLRNTSAGTNTASVTVNMSDLFPSDPQGWTTFKFASSQTLIAANNYALTLICSDASTQISFYRSSTANDFSRMLRTTGTASPGSGDQLIISNEFTGAGTSNVITVTMENTAATVFGSTSYIESISVSGKSILTWSTSGSTNYLLTLSGFITIWAGSTWNRGTSGARIPSSSTAKLAFQVATAGDSGLIGKAGSVINEYGKIVTTDSTFLTAGLGGYCTTVGTAVTRIRGQSFIGLTGTININGTNRTILSVTDADHLTLTGSAGSTANVIYLHAATGTVISVVSTTGWSIGDSIVIAPVNKTSNSYELVTIVSVDSSTQVTVNTEMAFPHFSDAISPTDIIHLTRNVSTYTNSISLTAYVQFNTTCVANHSYVENYFLGTANAGQAGVEVRITTGSYIAIGCTGHDFSKINSCGWAVTGANSNNVSITYCHTFNMATNHFRVDATTGTNIVLDHCIGIYVNFSSGNLFSFGDVGNTYTNLTAIGSTSNSNGFLINEATEITGTISGLKSHSHALSGIQITSVTGGTISIDSVYYNNANGISLNNCTNLTINGNSQNICGNSTCGITCLGCADVLFKNYTINSDNIFSCIYGFLAGSMCGKIYFENCLFGPSGAIFTSNTSGDINVNLKICTVILRNCNLASTVDVISFSGVGNFPAPSTCVLSEKHNQTSGLHKRWEKYGTAIIDFVLFKTASPAETLTPNNAISKLNSSPTSPVGISTGFSGTVTVYVYKSATYNGNQPRLILKSNAAIGFTSDVVLATASGSTGTWLVLSGTTPTATDDGAFVCYVDCDGTIGTVTVDDWSAT